MKEYRVSWTIDLEAESPLAAAREALRIQMDPGSTAVVFTVKPAHGKPVTVDLGREADLRLIRKYDGEPADARELPPGDDEGDGEDVWAGGGEAGEGQVPMTAAAEDHSTFTRKGLTWDRGLAALPGVDRPAAILAAAARNGYASAVSRSFTCGYEVTTGPRGTFTVTQVDFLSYGSHKT